MRYVIVMFCLMVSQFVLADPYTEKVMIRDLEEMTREWEKENPHSLPHWLTPEELTRLDEIGRDFSSTDPPVGPVRNIAEFEPMEGVLIRYPFGISYGIIAEMSEDCMVTTIVANQSQENYVRGQYGSNGVNLASCNFLHAPTESYWTRDYGPWYVVDGSNQVGIVNFPYNRPRPNDNDIPIEMANFLNIPLYGMDLTHAGGNYMTDGMGISSSSELVWEENSSMTHGEIDQMVEDYLGVETYHVIPDPNNTYIDHIDCWGKFLAVDKVMIREVGPTHPQYDEIEATAAYFASHTSAYGTPYRVYRVYTSSMDRPYTNSLILNKKVLVPMMGSAWDDDAIASYEEAMPGYEVLGFTGSWVSTDALHCRAKGVADRGMLYIRHIPVQGGALPRNDYEIQAEILPLSGEAVIAESVFVYYKLNDGPYIPLNMTPLTGNTWTAMIPAQQSGTEIAYYIHAADESGRSENNPYIGAPDPHVFTASGLNSPDLTITHSGSELTLSWETIPGATSYKVYSSDEPYSGFAEDSSGTFDGTSWTVGMVFLKRFYYVTAADEPLPSLLDLK